MEDRENSIEYEKKDMIPIKKLVEIRNINCRMRSEVHASDIYK